MVLEALLVIDVGETCSTKIVHAIFNYFSQKQAKIWRKTIVKFGLRQKKGQKENKQHFCFTNSESPTNTACGALYGFYTGLGMRNNSGRGEVVLAVGAGRFAGGPGFGKNLAASPVRRCDENLFRK